MIWGVSCDSVPQWPGEARFPSPTVLLHFALTELLIFDAGSALVCAPSRVAAELPPILRAPFCRALRSKRCPGAGLSSLARIARQGAYVGHRTDSTFPERLWCVHDLMVTSARSCRSTAATPYFVEPMSTFVRRELRRSILRPNRRVHFLFLSFNW